MMCLRPLEGHSKQGRHCAPSADTTCLRAFYRTLFVTAILGCGAVPNGTCDAAEVRGEARARPNIVVIVADDMGYGDASTYGGWIDTPRLDQLARSGMKFTDFHASGNVCSPTRAGLLTGRYQQRAGIAGVINADPKVAAHHNGLDPKETTLAELLRDAGYATAIFGKWHLGYATKFNPLHHGFDRFRGYVSGNVDYISHYDRMGVYDWWDGLTHVRQPGYTTHLITQYAVEFIEQNQHRPFCVYVAHEAVHSPFQGPTDPPLRGPERQQRRGKVDVRRTYREMMKEMDTGIGQVVDTIERLGIERRTFVFFFSDNGGTRYGSNAPLRGFKGSNWEGGHRVPAIAWWPQRIPAGSQCRELTISLDLMPTMLAIAAAPVPSGHRLDGVNLLPVMLEGKTLGDRQLFWNGRAMRDGPWKLIVGGRGEPGIGLYHLDSDIGEQKNVADQRPQRVRTMQAALATWQRDVTTGATPQASQAEP